MGVRIYMLLKLLTFSVLFSFSGQVLHSEEYEDPFAEDSQSGNSAEALFFQLEQNILVKSATKIKQTLTDAPSIISVITADQIRYRNYQSVAEALADLPGFFVGNDHAFYDAGVRGVTGELRGKSRTLKVMINGQPISFRIETANFIGKELIPMSAIEKIEVIRGPGSALYGANAFLGVVNIVTKTGEQVSGGGLATKAVIFGENLGYSGEFYAGEKFGDLDVFISVAKNRTDRSGLKLDSSQKSLNGAIPGIFEKESFDDISQPTSIFTSFSYDLGKAGEISAFMNHQSIDTRASFADWGTLNHLDGVEASGNRIGLENNLLSGKYTLGFLDGKAELSVGTNYAEGKAADHDELRKGNDPGTVISRDHYGYEGIDIFGEFRYTIYEDAAEDAEDNLRN